MLELAGYIATLGAGLVLGLLGGGGSILAIPILIYLFRLETVEATAYSLFMVGTASMIGCFQRSRFNCVDFKVGVQFGIPSILGVFVTRMWMVPNIPAILFQSDHFVLTKRLFTLGLFSLMVIMASMYMLQGSERLPDRLKNENLVKLVLSGAIIGILTGLVGMGGGFLIVPAIYFLTGLDLQKSIGTTLFIIALKSILGFLGDVSNSSIDWTFLLIISVLSMVGMVAGTYYSQMIRVNTLKKVFGWFILSMGIVILIHESF